MAHIIDANHKKHFGRLAFNQRIEAVDNAHCYVAADTAVYYPRVIEKLMPFAAVGD